jgi:hypothetical protein
MPVVVSILDAVHCVCVVDAVPYEKCNISMRGSYESRIIKYSCSHLEKEK